MSENHIFHKCEPICINLLNISDTNDFYIHKLYIIIGNIDNKIIKSIENVYKSILDKKSKISNNDKSTLKEYFGKEWYNLLFFNIFENLLSVEDKKYTGGSILSNDWDEIDESDFDEMINKGASKYINNNYGISKTSSTSLYKIFNNKQIEMKFIYDINIYKEDTIEEFKNKIELITGIPYYKQYVSYNDNVLGYYINIDDGINDDIIYPNILDIDFNYMIAEVPVNNYYNSIINNMKIVVIDYNTKMSNYGNIFNLLTLDSFKIDKQLIYQFMNSDIVNYNLIYNSFINIYFPVITENIFILYLSDENEIYSIYPSISLDKKVFKEKLKSETKLIETINDVQEKENTFISNTKSINITFDGYKNKIIFIKKLFENIEIEKVSYENNIILNFLDICINTSNGSDLTVIRKINTKKSIVDNNLKNLKLIENTIYFHFHNYMDTSIKIELNEYGKIYIHISTDKTIYTDKEKMVAQIVPIVDVLLELINSLSEVTFIENKYLPLLSSIIKNNKIVNNLFYVQNTTVSLLLNNNYTYNDFINIMNILLDTNIVKYAKEDKSDTITTYILNKNITSFSKTGIDYISNNSKNMYDYLTDEGKNKSMMTLFDSKKIQIMLVKNTFVINIINLNIEENKFYTSLIVRLSQLFEKQLVNEKIDKTKLKLVDPILFNFKADTLYPRLCQKKMQPIVTNKNDKKAVKLKNITYNTDEYYVCKDKVYSHLGFLIGQHPDGYCLPCCRKREMDNIEFNKCVNGEAIDNDIHDKTYIQYIMEYPNSIFSNFKILDRKIHLPKYIQKVFSSSDYMINGTFRSLNDFKIDGSFDMVNIYSTYYNSNVKDFCISLITFLKSSFKKFSYLLDSKIINYFYNLEKLIEGITNKFILQNNNLLYDAIPWNDIIIQIMYYYGLNTIVLEDNRDEKGIMLRNIEKIKDTNNTILVLKRIDIDNIEKYYESVNYYHYLPISKLSKSKKDVKEIITLSNEIINICKSLYKNINYTIIKNENKTFSIENIINICEKIYKTYKIEKYVNSNNIISKIKLKCNNNVFILQPSKINNNNENVKSVFNIKYDNLGSVQSVLEFIEKYNKYIISLSKKDNSLNLYVKYNIEKIKNYLLFNNDRNNSVIINYDDYEFYLIRLYKFIIYNNNIIGAIIIVEHNSDTTNKIISKHRIYFNNTDIKVCINIINNHIKNLLETDNISDLSYKILFSPLSHFYKSKSIIKYNLKNINSLLQKYNYLLCYFQEDIFEKRESLTEIKNKINKHNSIEFTKEYIDGYYDISIYKLYANHIVNFLKSQKSLDIKKFVLDELNKLSVNEIININYNNLTNLTNLCKTKFYKDYDENIIELSLSSLINFINSLKIDKKEKNIKKYIINEITNNNILEDLYIHSLINKNYDDILKLLNNISPKIIIKIKTINYLDFIKSNSKEIYNMNNPLFYKNKKLLIKENLLNNKNDVTINEILAKDLTNPFKKKYIWNNLQFINLINNSNIKYFKNELIYISIIE